MSIPVTVLGGYLGSGKTTRVNELLAQTRQRIVVVVNDFGAVNIDAELIAARGTDTIELANGCLCCSLAEGIGPVLQGIAGLDPPPTGVVIEVSGVGDPSQVASWAGYPGLSLNLVVVCCDATNLVSRARDRWVGDTVHRQVGGADVVVLTKLDVATADQVRDAHAWLRRHAPQARVVTDDGALTRLVGQPAAAVRGGMRPSVARPRPPHADHDSLAVTGSALVDSSRLRAVLARLPESVVRVKGFVRLAPTGLGATVQRVDDRLELTPGAALRDRNRLVLISGMPTDLATAAQELIELLR